MRFQNPIGNYIGDGGSGSSKVPKRDMTAMAIRKRLGKGRALPKQPKYPPPRVPKHR